MDLRKLLLRIGADMRESDLEYVKFYCGFPNGVRERIKYHTDLWEELEKRGDISFDDSDFTLTFLRRMLDPMNFHSSVLIDHVRKFTGEIDETRTSAVANDPLEYAGMHPAHFKSMSILVCFSRVL